MHPPSQPVQEAHPAQLLHPVHPVHPTQPSHPIQEVQLVQPLLQEPLHPPSQVWHEPVHPV